MFVYDGVNSLIKSKFVANNKIMQLNWIKDYNLLMYETIDSTNSEALKLARSGVNCNLVITANSQTSGRGSKGREWCSIPGNLHASILLKLDSNVNNFHFPFMAANALHNTLEYFFNKHNKDCNIQLKWPNDVLINGKKIAGILIESIVFNKQRYVVIGIGVNILEAPIDVKRYSVTSLYDLDVILNHSDEFLYPFMGNFDLLYKEWQQLSDFNLVKDKWLKSAYQLNEVVTIDDGLRRISGVFKGLGINGEIILSLSNGQECRINAGDVLV